VALTLWRAGQMQEVTLKLPALGNYSATAAYNCPKSKRIFERGCKALAGRMPPGPMRRGCWSSSQGL